MPRQSSLPSCSGREPQQSTSSSHEPGYIEDDESHPPNQRVNYVQKKKKFKRRSHVVIKKAIATIATIETTERERKKPSAPSKTDIVKIYFQYRGKSKPTQCYFCNYNLRFNVTYLSAHLIRVCPGVPPDTREKFREATGGQERRFSQQMRRTSTTVEPAPASIQDTNESDNQVEVNAQNFLEDATHVKSEEDEDCKIIGYEGNHEQRIKRIEREKAELELKKEELELKKEELELKKVELELKKEELELEKEELEYKSIERSSN